LALVYKTGFNTSKGNLIRSIIYPKNIDIKFKQDSIKYIYLMGCLSIIGFTISIPFLKNADQSTSEIIKKCLDLITTAVPPSLPACLGIGISYAVNRLKSQNIICINRDRVNLLGKINTIVFDKTGTLTEDHLDIHGFRPIKVKSNEFVFDSFLKDPKKNSLNAFNYYKEKKNYN
jgi:cation-transporting ATPase 13A3/4/5